MAGYFAGQDKENKNSYLIISGGGYDGNVNAPVPYGSHIKSSVR